MNNGLELEILRLTKENSELKSELTHWKNNHAAEVSRARVLKERLDMPLERVRAYDLIGKLQSDLEEFNTKLATCEELVCNCESASIGRFVHYKGGVYDAICEAHLESDRNQKVVIYKALADDTIWSRPTNDFYGTLIHGDKQVLRFTPLDEEH